MSAVVSNSWRATKLKFAGRVVAGGTPESGNPDYWDGPVPWLTPVDLGNERNDAITASKRTLTEAGVRAAGLELLPVGSVVFSTRAPIGSVGLLACEAVTNQGCKALVLDSRELDSRFSFYLALDSAEALQSLGLGTTFTELSTYALKNLPVSLPPPIEQRRIAGYLDEATGKVDRLVALRRRQMELLREQRAALIQQAVTGRLDCGDTSPLSSGATCRAGKSADMSAHSKFKDSGLPWLGQIPKHWQLVGLRRIAKYGTSITYGIVQAGPHVQGGIPYIRTSDMSGDSLPFEGYLCTTPEIDASYRRSKVQTGDVVVAIRATIGKALPVPPELDGANLTQGTAKVSPGPRITTDYLLASLQSKSAQLQFGSLAKGTTFMEITLDMLRKFKIPLPPKDEQEAISDYLKDQLPRFDQLHTAYTRQLELLTEYRAALIHECVTGQRAVPAN